MAVPVIASSIAATSGGAQASSLTLTKPAGVANGDLLIVVVGGDADNAGAYQPTDTPAGWNLISSASGGADADIAAFWRIADGTEGATLIATRNALAGTDELYGWYLRITGADVTTPINQTGANSGTFDLAGVTTGKSDCLAFGLLGGDGGDMFPYSTTSPGWAKLSDQRSGSSGASASGVIFTKEMATAGDTGVLTVVSTVSDGRYGFQFAVAPGVSGGGGVTGELVYTHNPDYTASIVSSVDVDGSLEATHAPNYSFVGSGSVEIEGGLSAAHSPTYNFAGFGTVGLSASLAANHPPTYALAAIGSVSISGNLVAEYEPAYIFSASVSTGYNGITAQLSATYSSELLFAASGETHVSGVLSAQCDPTFIFSGVGSTGNLGAAGYLNAIFIGGYTFSATGSVLVSGGLNAIMPPKYGTSIDASVQARGALVAQTNPAYEAKARMFTRSYSRRRYARPEGSQNRPKLADFGNNPVLVTNGRNFPKLEQ